MILKRRKEKEAGEGPLKKKYSWFVGKRKQLTDVSSKKWNVKVSFRWMMNEDENDFSRQKNFSSEMSSDETKIIKWGFQSGFKYTNSFHLGSIFFMSLEFENFWSLVLNRPKLNDFDFFFFCIITVFKKPSAFVRMNWYPEQFCRITASDNGNTCKRSAFQTLS